MQTTVAIQDPATADVACIAGMVASTLLMVNYIKRAVDTTGREDDWPGPRASPAGMALVGFFCLFVCLQSINPGYFGL